LETQSFGLKNPIYWIGTPKFSVIKIFFRAENPVGMLREQKNKILNNWVENYTVIKNFGFLLLKHSGRKKLQRFLYAEFYSKIHVFTSETSRFQPKTSGFHSKISEFHPKVSGFLLETS
jgi:hypothetical protein